MTCNLFREGLCDSRIQRGGTTHGLFLPEEPLRKSQNGQPICVISINRAHRSNFRFVIKQSGNRKIKIRKKKKISGKNGRNIRLKISYHSLEVNGVYPSPPPEAKLLLISSYITLKYCTIIFPGKHIFGCSLYKI